MCQSKSRRSRRSLFHELWLSRSHMGFLRPNGMLGSALLAAAALVVVGTPTVSRAEDKDVIVINGATQPVPVTVQGTPSITGSVAISGTPSVNVANTPSVQVTNTPTVALAPGSAVELTPAEPYQVGLVCLATNVQVCQQDHPSLVPAGKRFVVETVSGGAHANIGDEITTFNLYSSTGRVQGTFNFIGKATRTDSFYTYSILDTRQVRIYIDGGTTVGLGASVSGNSTTDISASMRLSGYLVPMP